MFSSPTGRIKLVESGKRIPNYRSAPNVKLKKPMDRVEGARQKAGKILWETPIRHMYGPIDVGVPK
jgi:hypothetical protein